MRSTTGLRQYPLDSAGLQRGYSPSVEICVESVIESDPEEAVVEYLMKKFLLQKHFGIWRSNYTLCRDPALNALELQGINSQAEFNGDHKTRRARRHFLYQFARLATFSMDRTQKALLFHRWYSHFFKRRTDNLKASTLSAIHEKRMAERPFNAMKQSLTRHSSVSSESRSSPDRLRRINEELERVVERNRRIEEEIAAKKEELDDLKSGLRSAASEETLKTRQIEEFKQMNASLQEEIAEAERCHLEEISALQMQLSLLKGDADSELSKVTGFLEKSESEKKAASAFIDDANAAASIEIREGNTKLATARKAVASLREVYESEVQKCRDLNMERQKLLGELENTRIKRKQTESMKTSQLSSAESKEERMRQLLAEAQKKLESAVVTISNQAQTIKSKQLEIQQLERDIAIQKEIAKKAQSRFLSQYKTTK